MLVASSTSGSDVIAIDDGSVLTASTGGVHSEQNMLRVASWPPSLLRSRLTGRSVRGATGATFGP